jgi:colanic acid/amylovoran biosynthesis glycosyltransferase
VSNGSELIEDVMVGNDCERRKVAVFRQHLFKASETFIHAQTSHLENYCPVYVGRKLYGRIDGVNAILPRVPMHGAMASIDTIRMVGLMSPDLYIKEIEKYGRPDIVHAHFAVDGVYALGVAQGLGVPIVTTLHGFDVTRSKLDFILSSRPALMNLAFFEKKLKINGDGFICVSEFIKRKALERGYPEEKLYLHYIGVDVESITERPHENEVDGLVVHVARLVEKKGTKYLLRAFSSVVREYPSARLVIIGDGPLRSSLQKEAQILGISDFVEFLGEQPHSEVLRWDAMAAIKVVPSVTASNGDQEGLGIVNLEAAALGVPVVAFVDELASYIKMLLHDKDIRYRFGGSARKFIEKEFDIKRQTRRLEMLYDEIIEMHRRR